MTAPFWIRRGTFNWEGLAIAILSFAGIGAAGLFLVWVNTPAYICTDYKDVDSIEKVTVGIQVEQVVVTKSVCTKWEKNHE